MNLEIKTKGLLCMYSLLMSTEKKVAAHSPSKPELLEAFNYLYSSKESIITGYTCVFIWQKKKK